MDQRIMHIHHLNIRATFVQTCDKRIVFPESIGRRANVRLELPGVRQMQITDSRCEHHTVAGTLE